MTPAARTKTVIELLEIIGDSKIPMDSTIGDYMRRRRYIGSKDRAFIVQLTYDVVRAHARLSWWLDNKKILDTARNRLIFFLALEKKYDAKKHFDGSKYGPEELSKDEQDLSSNLLKKSLIDKNMPASVKAECPHKYENALLAYFGDDFEKEMNALIDSAPLDLRVNTWKKSREEVKLSLEKEGIETENCPYSVSGLRAKGKVYLGKTKAFRNGWVEIQDEGSQLIAQLCDVKPGMQVLDYCAGAGGKTLALASMMQNKGRIVAMDTEKSRLEKARTRFKRAGVSDIIEVRPLSEDKGTKWFKRQKGTFDVVLVDVPCSGTGTWRRNPDTRWREFGPSLEKLTDVQAGILDKVKKAVKPEGHLVYATCSLLDEENEKQVEAFLSRHPEFDVVYNNSSYARGPYMRLTPYRHRTDGFFAAVLKKR